MHSDLNEVFRYLGITHPIPEDLFCQVSDLYQRVSASVRPRFFYKVFPLCHKQDLIEIPAAGMALQGDLAKKMLDRGFFFSAIGILNFKNSDEVRETFAKIPLDKIVIETDAPYCAPVPHRGKICEPYMVVETARVLSEIKNVDMGALEKILMENVKKLYPKIEL